MFESLMGGELTEILPLAALYAETHYRFRFFPFSLYYRKLPEIIFDAPLRIEPGQSLPVFMIVKDCDQFPVTLKSITITVSGEDHNIVKQFTMNENLNSPFWHRIFQIDIADFSTGNLKVDCRAEIVSNRKTLIIQNDNHPKLSHAPFEVLKAEHYLPLLPGWSAGELHCHTSFGTDQIEFGAPLEFYQQAAEAMGLGWVALTDHAYNMDDLPDNYLVNDPMLKKWAMFLSDVDRANSSNSKVILLPGEELTCRSSTGKNIHLLMIGQRNFLIGTGDDAQNWVKVRSEHSVQDAIRKVDPDAVAIAAHPLTPISFLEKLLLNRDAWTEEDLHESGLSGWQMWNGQMDEGFHIGMNLWKKALDQGKKIYLFAGNDAHGNFNRYRQISLPMVSMRENSRHLFGKITTRLKTGSSISQKSILNALREGNCTVSDGPSLDLKIISKMTTTAIGSELLAGDDAEIQIEYLTTPEYGELKEIRLISGLRNNEFKQAIITPKTEPKLQKWTGKLARPVLGDNYVRAELITEHKTGRLYHSFTNPIWL